jgi:hypothetical protein
MSHRVFTDGSSPLNSALPVEETYRKNADNKNACQLVFLDAKSAFDVVMHSLANSLSYWKLL